MPAISATPSAIAMPVSSDAQLALQEAAQDQREHQPTRLHQVERLLGRDRRAVVDDPPVGEHEQAVGEGGGVRVVGDHHDGLARSRRRRGAAARARRRRLSSRGCRRARRRTRPPGARSSARATATRCCWPPDSSAGRWLEAVADADRVDEPVEPLAVGLAPGDRQRQQDVLFGVRAPAAG